MATKTFKNFEDFHAHRTGKKASAPADGDALSRFYKTGWWHNGEIVEYEGRALPTTIRIETLEDAKREAAKGSTPLEFVRDEVFALFLSYHGGADKLPGPIAEVHQARLAAKAAADEAAKLAAAKSSAAAAAPESPAKPAK